MSAKRFAFISRHEPTEAQRVLALRSDILLTKVPDVDAFGALDIEAYRHFAGVVCVHPALALRLYQAGIPVGVFNNINRAAVGETPRFATDTLVVFSQGAAFTRNAE